MSQVAEGPEGFGGWLLLVVIGQWLGFFGQLMAFIWTLPTWVGQWRDPALHRATMGEAGLSVGLLAFMLYTAIMMNMKRREFPTLFRIEVALFVIVPLLSIWWVARSTGAVVDKATFAGIATQAVAATIGASFSILYSVRSARVRNTFIY
jgi:hypothetical protein